MLLPPAWFTGFGIATLNLWLGNFLGRTGAPPPDATKWKFLIGWVFGSAFILWTNSGLKRVRVDSENLYVSNYLREISVPLTMITDVTENRWLSIHPVTVHFGSMTGFGQRITFMPPLQYFGLWRTHPVVAELRRLAGLVHP